MTEQRQRLQVLCGGIFSLLLSLGVARFAYTPLLPLMQEQAGLGIRAAGWLAAINYAGYLCGALAASFIGNLVLKDRLYRVGMVVAVISTLLMGLTTDVVLWAVLRFVGGLSAAAGMLLGTGLILNWLIRHHHRSELGIHFSGIGLGIAACAALVEFLTRGLDWREQWFAFAALGAVLLIPALRWVPGPDASGLTTTGQKMEDRPPGALYLRIFIAAYFCAGFAYVIGATFIVAIVNKLPDLAGQGNLAFLAIGVGAAPACIVWDLVARRTGDLNALILAAVLQIVGILLPLLAGGLVMTIVGALLFGATFVGMVSLVMTMAGRYYPNRPAKMMGKMSMSYGAGQIAGPAATGALAAHSGSYEVGLYLAAAMMLLGTCLLLALRAVENGAAARAAADRDRSQGQASRSGRS